MWSNISSYFVDSAFVNSELVPGRGARTGFPAALGPFCEALGNLQVCTYYRYMNVPSITQKDLSHQFGYGRLYLSTGDAYSCSKINDQLKLTIIWGWAEINRRGSAWTVTC